MSIISMEFGYKKAQISLSFILLIMIYFIAYLAFYRPFLTCRKYEYPNGIRVPISTAISKL